MQFPPVNRYTNEEARNAWYALFAIFALWWIFNLISALIGGLFRRRTTADGEVAPYRPSKTRRITSALRDVVISSIAVVTLNYFTNGITRSFNILHWVAIWAGFLWALARGFVPRFGDLLQLPVIALYVVLFVFAFRHVSYLGNAID